MERIMEDIIEENEEDLLEDVEAQEIIEHDLTVQYFLSSLSHEIRTPLNGIVGYTQLLLQTQMNSTQQLYLGSMNRCCLQLMELINDILDFSKLSTGRMDMNTECFSFREVIDELNSTLGYRIKEKRQKCCYILHDELPKYIVCDWKKLIQILVNLVSNASKFTDVEGRIIISISPCDNNMLEFTVEDNGIGIDPNHHEQLFDAFFQVQESVTKIGSGLGLAICKKLCQLMNGDIGVESEIGKGSIFTFTIQYEPYEEFQEEVEHNISKLNDCYVLVVDDNEDNRLILSGILFDCQINPIICSSAREALILVSKNRYNFSAGLIDICMPRTSGTELAVKIKEICPNIPLIAVSSLDEPFDTRNFEYVLNKPIHKVRLLHCLTKVIEKNMANTCCLTDDEEDEICSNQHITQKDNIRILIAEDISYNLDMLKKMLESMQYYNIDTATNGAKAITKIDEAYNNGMPYDILLLDLKMPEVDGFGVIKHIREKNYTDLNIAILTASVINEDRDKSADLGVKYFILKPINMSHLRGVLEKMRNELI